jgi:type I restriction enzyme M protein
MAVADGKPRTDEFAQLRKLFGRFNSAADPARLRLIALTLVFLHERDPAGWAAARSSPEKGAREMIGKLPAEIGADVGDVLRDVPDLHHVLAAMLDTIGPIVDSADHAAVFRDLLEEFAADGGRREGTAFTPRSVSAVMAGALDIASASTVYDPFSRSGELLVAAAANIRPQELSAFGTTPGGQSLAIARMNMLLHNVQAEFGIRGVSEDGPSFQGMRKFARILTNPPFNLSHWADYDGSPWRYGPPPAGNANFAWLQYVVERLEPGGQAAVLMPNGAMFRSSPRERRIRMGMVEDGCVEALISLPPALFRDTGIPVTLWTLSPPGTPREAVLFVDASEAGHLIGRTRRELSDAEISDIIHTVTGWRSGHPARSGSSFGAVSVTLPEIRERNYDLSPHLYLSRPPTETSSEAVLPTVRRLLQQLEAQHAEAATADAAALRVLRGLAG